MKWRAWWTRSFATAKSGFLQSSSQNAHAEYCLDLEASTCRKHKKPLHVLQHSQTTVFQTTTKRKRLEKAN
eukprot:596727-Amphidinium_carterae.1